LNAVDQGMAREHSDSEKLKSLADNQRGILTEKLDVQQRRLDVLHKRLNDCTAPAATSTGMAPTATSTSSTLPTLNATSTKSSTSTPASTKPATKVDATKQPVTDTTRTPSANNTTPTQPSTTNPPVANPTTAPTAKSLGLVRIELFAQPNPANVGDRVILYVKGYTAAGAMDVTSYATFNVIGSLGTLSGSVFTAQKSGSVTLQATVADDGKTLNAAVSLPINQGPVALSKVILSAKPLQVMQGQTRAVFATAQYTNGLTKDVTSLTKFSSGGLGIMSGNMFTAGVNALGWTTITGTYAEEGVTQSGTLDLQVVPYTASATNLQ